jgi:tetratricopeptide (TPR) repeat protein
MAQSSKNRAAGKPSGRHLKYVWSLLLLALIGGALLFQTIRVGFFGNPPGPVSGDSQANDQKIFAQYAGSESCRECHAEEYRQWEPSHHSLAERMIRLGTDQAAFEPPRIFQHASQNSEVSWSNATPQLTCIGLSGKPETFPIERVIGEEPLRQFLVKFPGGRYQALEASFAPRSNQWFNVYGTEDRKPGEWGHWTGRGMNWNYMCASCHNTRLRRHYDEASDSYQTSMAERSIGCEACHGPLRRHNDWQKAFGKSGQKDPTIAKLSKKQVLDNCGTCHARRTELTGEFVPGDLFLDHFDLVLVDRSERYYADGQVHDEDYEYGSFLGSRMSGRGVVCLDCHNPHSMKTILPGNWLCLRCHAGGDTNAPVINPVTHSQHKVFGFDTNGQPVNVDLTTYHPESIQETGGECVNCHMPQTVYMQRHWRHDHGFTIPDPLLTKQFGIPNACNRCHKDKDADWSLKYCEKWYGDKMERPTRQLAQIIARAQRGEPGARTALVEWLGKEESPYWRGVLTGLLEPWATRPEVAAVLLQELKHTNALVRTAAASGLAPAISGGNRAARETLQGLLHDPVRSVRLAVALSMGPALESNATARRELEQYLANNADEPTGQFQAGLHAFSMNDFDSALRHFQKAVAWDPYSPPLRQELAVTLSALNRPQEALDVLKEACRLAPQDPESHYKLALAYNEVGNLNEAAAQLTATVKLDPRHASAWYNLGLAQNSLGQTGEAVESLIRGEAADPEDARIPYARATILAQLGRKAEAVAAARRVLELNPESRDARELLGELQAR